MNMIMLYIFLMMLTYHSHTKKMKYCFHIVEPSIVNLDLQVSKS